MVQKTERKIGYSAESTRRELSNEYQYDRVYRVFKNLRVLVLWTKVKAFEKVASGLEFEGSFGYSTSLHQ